MNGPLKEKQIRTMGYFYMELWRIIGDAVLHKEDTFNLKFKMGTDVEFTLQHFP